MRSRNIAFIVALGASVAIATPALAQDEAPSSTQTQYDSGSTSNGTSFRGVRLEGQIGGDRFQSQGTHTDQLGYGGAVGFDGQIGQHIVIGAEGTWWRGDDSENCTSPAGGTLCTKSFEEYGAAVRAGYLLSPNLLVYGKGGFVNNEQRKEFSGANGTEAGAYYDHYNTDGYQVGGGVEYSFNKMFYVNAEYKHSQYNDHTSRQRILAGIGIRFK